jgi:hypothetical protein
VPVTFEELDQRFPNGFVDAELLGLTVDYQCRTARMELSLRTNPPDSPDCNEYHRAVLSLNDFYYFVIEAPSADHLWYPQRAVQIDALAEDAGTFSLFDELKRKLSGDIFCCRFFVHDWNSFIHMAAKEAYFLLNKGVKA